MAANNEKVNGDAYQMLQSSFGKSSSSFPKQHQQQQQQQLPFLINKLDVPQLNMSQFHGQVPQLSPNLGFENTSRRVGIPPSHPQIPPISLYSRTPFNHPGNQQIGQQNFSTSPGPSHNRSLSQPSFFALDSLPPQSPSPCKDSSSNYMSDQASADVSMEEKDGNSHSFLPPPFTKGTPLRVGESLLPHKAHRRSNSDIPFGFSSVMESSLPLPLRSLGTLAGSVSNRDNSVAQPAQLVRRESTWGKGGESNGEGTGKEKTEREIVDELFSTYLNLDNIDAFNSSGTDEKLGTENQEDFDSRASGSKTNGCDNTDNEATDSVNEIGSSVQRPGVSLSGERREGVKRNAIDDIAPTSRHYRSVSMDSFMGKMNFDDESPSALPSPGATPGQLSPANSSDANSDAFSLDLGNGEFNGSELNKIMTNEKLVEIAISDPKRAKRILANRQSAARSKERKMRYIAELEHKVQTLQTEATTLSAQVTMLQRDFAGLTNHNNELKYRLHAMERQAQLHDALNETLVAEVQRLKLASAEYSGNASKFQQLSVNYQSFQQAQLNMHELQQQSNGNTAVKQ